jgi:hypothetical protein
MVGGKDLPPQQRGACLQQWQQTRVGWQVATWQLPPLETAAVCSQPLLQKVVGFFLFFVFQLVIPETINAR